MRMQWLSAQTLEVQAWPYTGTPVRPGTQPVGCMAHMVAWLAWFGTCTCECVVYAGLSRYTEPGAAHVGHVQGSSRCMRCVEHDMPQLRAQVPACRRPGCGRAGSRKDWPREPACTEAFARLPRQWRSFLMLGAPGLPCGAGAALQQRPQQSVQCVEICRNWLQSDAKPASANV